MTDKDRKFRTTHPWISFSVDLNRAPFKLWPLLGEIRSKCSHISGVPLKPEVAKQLTQLFMTKGVRATTAIEGNTLSEEDVGKRVRDEELSVPESMEYQKREVENVIGAMNRLVTELQQNGPRPKISPTLIRNFNLSVLDGLPLEDGVVPGKYRAHSAGVPGYRGAPPEDCEYLVDRLCDWLNGEVASSLAQLDLGVGEDVIRSILAHLYLEWIHPFGDGNGRTGRMLEFYILVNGGVPHVSSHMLSNFYFRTRAEYYRQLDKANKSGGDPLSFIEYAVSGLVEELRQQLDTIRTYQWEISWRDYVYGFFEDKRSPRRRRQRDLVLALGRQSSPTPKSKLTLVSPDVAQSYATKTDKTLSRDLKDLLEYDLIEETVPGIIAKKLNVIAFLPLTAPRAS